MPERFEIKPLTTIGSAALFLGAGFLLTNIAFGGATRDARQQVISNAKGQCQWTGDDDHCGTLQASHIDHTKGPVNGVDYNDPRRMESLCIRHHQVYHAETPPELLGLSEQHNNQAVGGLAGMLLKFIRGG